MSSGTRVEPKAFTRTWFISNPVQSYLDTHRHDWTALVDWSRLSNRALLRKANPFERSLTLGYSRVDYTYTAKACSLNWSNNNLSYTTSGQFISPPPVKLDHLNSANVEAKAYARLVDKLFNAQLGNFDAVLFAAEGAKLKATIAEKGKLVSDQFDAFERRHRREHRSARNLLIGNSRHRGAGRRILKRLTSRYLEFTYAITPLLLDIDNAAEDLARLGEKTSIRIQRFTGTAEESEDPTSRAYLGIAGMNNTYWFLYLDERRTATANFHGAYRHAIDIDADGKVVGIMLRQRSRSLVEFVPTIWELIPYSFLMDYLFNIDSLMRAGALDGRYTIVYSHSVKLVNEQRHHAQDATGYWNGAGINNSYGTLGDNVSTSKSIRFVRYGSGYNPTQLLMSTNIPSPKQWANTLALAMNRFL